MAPNVVLGTLTDLYNPHTFLKCFQKVLRSVYCLLNGLLGMWSNRNDNYTHLECLWSTGLLWSPTIMFFLRLEPQNAKH